MTPPTSSHDLQSFIAHARSKGMDHQTIRMLLLSAGWKERDVARGIGQEGLDMPVPLPVDAGGARDAFFHLLTFAGLYAVVISFLVLAFAYIDRWLPDAALERYMTEERFRSGIRWPLAALIVAFPIFVWMSRLLLQEMRQHSEKQAGSVRRWLTYLTLFVAASVLMINLMTLVVSLLSGEVTLRFVFKIAVVFVVAGMGFFYYFTTLRRPIAEHGRLHRLSGAVASAIVVATVVYGVVLAGTPGTARLRRIDDQRVEDVRAIARAAFSLVHPGRSYGEPAPATAARDLPQTLDELVAASPHRRLPTTDPDGAPYLYARNDATHFRICSTFALADDKQELAPFWSHPAGAHCYVFDLASQMP